MKLASGAAPVPKYLAAGVTLGLGTDGAASNNDLDMFEAMRQAAFLAQARVAATRARCRRRRRSRWRRSAAPGRSAWSDSIGSLEAGKRADLIVVAMNGARQTPLYDPVSHLVYVTRGDDVRTTIVNGQGADARPAGADARRARGARATRARWPQKVRDGRQ